MATAEEAPCLGFCSLPRAQSAGWLGDLPPLIPSNKFAFSIWAVLGWLGGSGQDELMDSNIQANWLICRQNIHFLITELSTKLTECFGVKTTKAQVRKGHQNRKCVDEEPQEEQDRLQISSIENMRFSVVLKGLKIYQSEATNERGGLWGYIVLIYLALLLPGSG